MADLVLDYSLLHDLAGAMRLLRGQIEADVNEVNGRAVVGAHGEVSSDAIGSSTMFSGTCQMLCVMGWMPRVPLQV